VEFPGAIYHVLNRGDRRENIFRDEVDRERFLDTLGEACGKTGWQVHAYCLMGNHFHLVTETPEPNLVAGMKWFLGTYTLRFNRRYKVPGHLFSGRYKSIMVGGEGGHLRTVCEYVHLNPVRAGLLRDDEPLRSYRWSSFGEYLKPPGRRVNWLRVDRVLGECGIPTDSSTGRREFERLLEARRREPTEETFAAVRRGWYVGSEEFKRELLQRLSAGAGPQHYGVELRESAEARAERIIAEELRSQGWGEADLEGRRKGDPVKTAIAARLRRETTVTLAWIANRLRMGTRTHLAHLLYWHRREERPSVPEHDTMD